MIDWETVYEFLIVYAFYIQIVYGVINPKQGYYLTNKHQVNSWTYYVWREPLKLNIQNGNKKKRPYEVIWSLPLNELLIKSCI